jgi:hypothetical protein
VLVRLPPRQRLAVALWVVMVLLLWNGIYDLVLVRGVKEYLFRAALAAAGRGPQTPIAQVMDVAVYEAVWIATFWASAVFLAGLLTIRLLDRTDTRSGARVRRRQ